MSLMKQDYQLIPGLITYQKYDFTVTIGSYDFYFVSCAPLRVEEYLTLTRPYDLYTWALIGASLVGVSISLILIDKIRATWTTESSTIFQSKNKKEVYKHYLIFIIF